MLKAILVMTSTLCAGVREHVNGPEACLEPKAVCSLCNDATCDTRLSHFDTIPKCSTNEGRWVYMYAGTGYL